MKIGLLCNAGGHLTEMLCLKGAWEQYDHFFMTQPNKRTGALDGTVYEVEDPEIKPLSFPGSVLKAFRTLLRERPDVILSTGFSWMDIPIFFFAKLMKIHTIYVESWCMTDGCTGTGKIVKVIADEFLVQWPDAERTCGPKAKYRGGIA
jgi:UDP-N-acetylglucosamine:LPS N-acetylglucosamine transferase